MSPSQLQTAPEFAIVPMLVLLPVACLHIGYKLVQGVGAFTAGFDEA